MEAVKSSQGNIRLYELTLSQSDVQTLDSGYPEGIISPRFPTGERFQIFSHPYHFSESFQPLAADPETYYIYIGSLNIKHQGDLEKLITNRGKIPIEIQANSQKTINVGYVTLKIA